MVTGNFRYQSESVAKSIRTTGEVFLQRLPTGSDTPPVGTDPIGIDVEVEDGRGKDFTLDRNGFCLVDERTSGDINFLMEGSIVNDYYALVCKLVCDITGAKEAYAFDHNVRSSEVVSWANPKDKEEEKEAKEEAKGEAKGVEQGEGAAETSTDTSSTTPAPSQQQQKIQGGNLVQSPAFVVHGDYTITSAPARVRQLAQPPRINDTWKELTNGQPLIDADKVEEVLTGNRRWAMINVWRNIVDEPVYDNPLAVCDACSVPPSDLVTFEVRYVDRTGENYFAGHSDGHRWVYFPRMTREEAILLKTWDSVLEPVLEGSAAPSSLGIKEGEQAPIPFSIHSAFKDPSAPKDCPQRNSIEVRTVAFW